MSEERPSPSSLEGPPSYDNWRAFLRGEPSLAAYEYLVYSDAWITGEPNETLGPYRFFNILNFSPDRAAVRAKAVLRFELHLQYPDPDLSRTDVAYYHGGFASDEVVALASLLTGIRLSAGTESRRFVVGGDPRGYPTSSFYRPEPSLTLSAVSHILPNKTGQQSLMPVLGLRSYPAIPGGAAVALVRAARMYQDALWIAEAQPNLAWLLLVGCVETAANYASTRSTEPPLDRIRASNSQLAELLEAVDNQDVRHALAHEVAWRSGSTKKFREFLLTFLPPPPQQRPGEWAQVHWSADNLKGAFNTIYGHRSRALHTGVPFPASMCEPPEQYQVNGVPAERPSGMSYKGGTWVRRDAPMCLHVFEYIVRHAIVSWWQSFAG